MKPEFRCAPSTTHGLEFAHRFVRRSCRQSAILILIDGDPVYRPIEGTDLQRIMNTKPVGYTAGYLGTVVSDGVVVHGRMRRAGL